MWTALKEFNPLEKAQRSLTTHKFLVRILNFTKSIKIGMAVFTLSLLIFAFTLQNHNPQEHEIGLPRNKVFSK